MEKDFADERKKGRVVFRVVSSDNCIRRIKYLISPAIPFFPLITLPLEIIPCPPTPNPNGCEWKIILSYSGCSKEKPTTAAFALL